MVTFAAQLLINLLRAEIFLIIWQVTCTITQILAEKKNDECRFNMPYPILNKQ